MDTPDINSYGDSLVPTTGRHGADIASQRIDDLDREALRQILELSNTRINCLDIGCGFGWQGIRFATLGAASYLFDLLPESSLIRNFQENTDLLLSYKKVDARQLNPEDLPQPIDLAFSQRFIHYLKYPEAERLIQILGENMPANAFFYISASGLHSELGEGYAGANNALQSRFSPLSHSMQVKHDIREPVCLYTESELVKLMTSNKFMERKVWKSTFGNVKGVFQKVL
jgi:SAM-dependent methyltransferase